ncbi:hypothetical protein [Niallia sp. RD1]|uniref:hypothetical protein n=1 Tax=Niallia sp. RD1 TaxID=2962858 RepID=UPI0020C1A48D|nr:hypothetical protein [Niallia sp. RD1]UTI41036.1 hypothetical protein NKG37_19540 [Niallia sp. RD1]
MFLSTFILTITDLIGPFNTIGSGTAALKEKNDELYKEIKVYREEHKLNRLMQKSIECGRQFLDTMDWM